VCQPFELVTVIVGHVPVQPVESVTSCPAFTVNMAVRWPAQLSVTELGPESPFMASTRTTRRGVDTNVKLALVGPPPLKLMLLVPNRRHGLDRYQALLPQS